MKAKILRKARTDEVKRIRRIYGDDGGGYCKFADRYYYPAEDGCSNTLTSVLKDNYVLIRYDKQDIADRQLDGECETQ